MRTEIDLVTEDAEGEALTRSRAGGIGDSMKVALTQGAGVDSAKDTMKTVDGADEYDLIVAGTANQVCGPNGAVGDILGTVVLAVTAAGTVIIYDNTTPVLTIVYTGAVNGPSVIPVGKRSLNGAWKITTPAGITGMAGGVFS